MADKEKIKAGVNEVYEILSEVMVRGADAGNLVKARQILIAMAQELQREESGTPQLKHKTKKGHSVKVK